MAELGGYPADPYYGVPYPETEEFLSGLPEYRKVPWGYYDVSDKPMASFGYTNCGAVVLMSDEAALSHMYPYDDHAEYIDRMLREMCACPKDLSAFVAGGLYKDIIEYVCREKGLDVSGVYPENGDVMHFAKKKDVVVIPSGREVFVFAKRESVWGESVMKTVKRI